MADQKKGFSKPEPSPLPATVNIERSQDNDDDLPVDVDPEPEQVKKEEDYVRLTCTAVKVRAGEAPVTHLREMFHGKNITLSVGGKGKVMTRACATHIMRHARDYSMQAELSLEEVS